MYLKGRPRGRFSNLLLTVSALQDPGEGSHPVDFPAMESHSRGHGAQRLSPLETSLPDPHPHPLGVSWSCSLPAPIPFLLSLEKTEGESSLGRAARKGRHLLCQPMLGHLPAVAPGRAGCPPSQSRLNLPLWESSQRDGSGTQVAAVGSGSCLHCNIPVDSCLALSVASQEVPCMSVDREK